MQHTFRNAALVLIAILVALWAVWPPKEKLRLGKDLSGGVSLIYSVQMSPNDEPRQVMSRLIEVLKDRVDPKNQLDISFVPQGRDRLEITMPLPTGDIRQLRRKVEEELERVGRSAISEEAFERVMRAEPAEREAQIEQLAGGNPARAGMLRDAAGAFDQARAAREAYAAAEPDDAAERERLEAEAADAEIRYDELRTHVLASAISADEIRRILELSNTEIRKLDERTRTAVTMPSPRTRALERLEASHPEAVEDIRRVVALWDHYQARRKTLDDPEDLIRLLRGAGVLDFRITVDPGEHPEEGRLRQELRERGPQNVQALDVGWYRINRIENWFNYAQDAQAIMDDAAAFFRGRGYVVEEYDGEYWILARNERDTRLTRAEGDWRVARSGTGADDMGRPSITFGMDARGARLLANLTGANIGKRMAILLDDQVYTAPTLQGQISNSGQITGEFTPEERQYIVKTLGAGSLQAKLSPEPMSRDIVAPELGMDNLTRGLRSGVVAFVVCSVFLTVYYFSCGLIASSALIVNCLLLLGVMSLNRAAFTLPGIAGIVLIFGMAVDANVLIYERMREELLRGETLRNAVRLGYQRSLSAIVDGNLTNLIVSMVLIFLGTQEIRGFGITMTIGVLTTLFSQLVMTRAIFEIGINYLGWTRLRMLPMVVPGVQRLLTPSVDWLRLRPAFYLLFAGLVALSATMIAVEGERMLDSQFRGGTEIRVQLASDESGGRIKRSRQDISDRLGAYLEANTDPALVPLRNADIVVVNPDPDGVTSSTFRFKTTLTDAAKVKSAVVGALDGLIDAQPEIHFDRADAARGANAPAFPVLERTLGANIGRPDVLNRVDDFIGGVAIVVADMRPAPTLESLRDRLAQTRGGAEFAEAASRRVQVMILDGTEQEVRSAAVLVRDPAASIFSSEEAWAASLRDVEWNLVRTSLTQATTLASEQSFSPAIAGTFAAQAVVAGVFSILLISIYVWVRFNSVRFSVAAIVPTMIDCFAAVGLIAFAELVFDHLPAVARAVGIEPYKIDLTMVAAVLTVLGYSINDKIVVLDRIRENRGKLTYVTRETVNRSINQVMSRTIMTSTTTIISTAVLYAMGAENVRGFAYALGLGIIVGTFSSIGLGAPLVWSKTLDRSRAEAEAETRTFGT